MNVVASLPADPKPAEAVQPSDCSFDDIPEGARAGAVGLASFGDDRTDAALPQQAAVLVVVVAAAGEQGIRPPPWPAHHPGYRGDLVEQGQELGDIVAVATGQRDRERDALALDKDVVLAARPCAVDLGVSDGDIRLWR
ncbi:hypothetical protein SSP35_52_00080 [Streptomyces sp. NBRC 110611]|nr:hypothetical protein SSP35_52_00080 [Streptomyces sp. NBRC 110611]